MEIWKDIPEFQGFYQASNEGRIRSLKRTVKQHHGSTKIKQSKILSLATNRLGYLVCALSVENKLTCRHVHGLVARAFLGFPEPDCYEVNHKDGNKKNNYAINLEWSNRSLNIKHAINLGLLKYKLGEDAHNSKISNVQRNEIIELKKTGMTLRELAQVYPISISQISKIVNYKTYRI